VSAAHAHPLRRLLRACRAGGLAGLLAGLVLVPASPVRASNPTPTTRAVTLASPGVVYVSTAANIPIRVTIPELQQLLGTTTVTDISTDWASGSGFVVNSNGTVITASHVVSFTPDEQDELKTYAVNRLFFGKLGRYHHERPTGSLFHKQSIRDPGWAQLLRWCYAEVYCQITPKPVVTVVTPAQGDEGRSRTLHATISTSAGFEETDITVLHADATNLPTAPLAENTGDLQAGQSVIALGFPSSAEDELKTGRTEATPVFGLISSVRSPKHGSGQVIQVDLQLESGMSGGPVINAEGKVIGLISFSGVEPGVGGRTQGYLRTVDDMQAALRSVGASAKSGEVDTLFAQAMNDYWTNHYSAAVSLYQRVLNLYDGHVLARRYLTLAQAEADGPDDIPLPRPQAAGVKQDSNTRAKVLALALLAVLVAALILLLALPVGAWLRRGWVRQRSRRLLARGPAGRGTAATGNGRSGEPPAPAGDGLPFGDGQTVAARAAGPTATQSQDEGASPA
jgi:S1-C subfamily serine protease